jgi:hypothetical protein
MNKTILQLDGPLSMSLANIEKSYVEVETEENQSFHAPLINVVNMVRNVDLVGTLTDDGNVPISTIRKNQAIAIRTFPGGGDGLGRFYDADATGGDQNVIGLLAQDTPISGTTTAPVVFRGSVNWSDVLAEVKDQRLMDVLAKNFSFPDKLWAGGINIPDTIWRRSSDYSLTAEISGAEFIATGAVTFNLPSLDNTMNGVNFHIFQSADARITLDNGGGNIVFGGGNSIAANAAASTLVFDATNNKVGTEIFIRCRFIGTNQPKWFVTMLCNEAHLSSVA